MLAVLLQPPQLRPLAQRWFMSDSERASLDVRAGATASGPSGSFGIGRGGFSAGAALAWAVVGIPIVWGIVVTSLDVMLVLVLQHRGYRMLEAVVVALIATIGACFLFEILISRPSVAAVLAGFVPARATITDPAQLYIAIGILGATVMPHNLYLHSSIVQTRKYDESSEGKREAIRYAFIDSTIALTFALFINAAILEQGRDLAHQRKLAEEEELRRNSGTPWI